MRLDRELHILEVIRLFIKHIQSQWEERDRQKARDEKNLLQFLQMIEEQQESILVGSRAFAAGQDSNVPKHLHRELLEIAEMQRTLFEEIQPLKDKISSELQQAAGQQPGQNAPGGADAAEAVTLLRGIADQAGKFMLSSADRLVEREAAAAVAEQSSTLGQLNQIYMAVAPYQNLLQRSIQKQQALIPDIGESTEYPNPADEAEGSTNKTKDSTTKHSTDGPESPETVNDPERDVAPDADQQGRITSWSQMLPLKAEQTLPQLKQQLQAMSESAATPETVTESKQPDNDNDPQQADEQAAQHQQQLEQLEGLIESMELALELSPEAESYSRKATDQLLARNLSAASAEQSETLRVLKEIAKPLKNQEQNEDQQNDKKDRDHNNEENKPDNQNSDQQEQSDQGEDSNQDQNQQNKDQEQQEPESSEND